MRRRVTALVPLMMTLLVFLAATAAMALPSHTFLVEAPDRSYQCAPVSVNVPLPKAANWRSVTVTDLQTKKPVPATAITLPGDEPSVEVTWLVRDLPEGGSASYRVAFAKKAPTGDPTVQVGEADDGAIPVNIAGELFTKYVFEGAPKPYCYPVIGPTGAAVTRGYPMEEIDGEATDHHHHRSLWFTFGEVNGIDFWAETDNSGIEAHREFDLVASGDACGVIATTNDWTARDGTKVLQDSRELRIYGLDGARLLDFSITLKATEGDVEFGDTKEGMFGFRLASTMRLDRGGHIVNSAGDTEGETWGKAAAWCDYYGPVAGETVGVAIMDHPQNLRHPTYWHVRSYGLFAANPFGLKHFINDDTGAGRYTLAEGEELTFRYRVLIHPGTTDEARVAEWFEEYADPPIVTPR